MALAVQRALREDEREMPTVISPIVFIIIWSIGLSQYKPKDGLFLYAVVDLVFACLVLVVQLLTSYNHVAKAYGIAGFCLFVAGNFLFKGVTKYSIFEMAVLDHSIGWITYPLLVGTVYFQLWMRLVFYSFVILYFVFGIVYSRLQNKKRKRRDARHRMQGTHGTSSNSLTKMVSNVGRFAFPANETEWTVTKFHDWFYKDYCLYCGEKLGNGIVKTFECDHTAHASCVIDDSPLCPDCKLKMEEPTSDIQLLRLELNHH